MSEQELQRQIEDLTEQIRLSKESQTESAKKENDLQAELTRIDDEKRAAEEEAEVARTRAKEFQTELQTQRTELERQNALLAGVLYFKNQYPGGEPPVRKEENPAVSAPREDAREKTGAEGGAGDTQSLGREMGLSMTFGEDTSPSSLDRFLTHWNLVDEINKTRGVRTWTTEAYRACILRMALRGPAADWISQESAMLSTWVKDDQKIIAKLKERYIKNTAIELHIIAFEQSSQKDGETISEYMVRLQKLIENAYCKHPAHIKQMRVVWQFLNGLRDRDVREVLIREKWMEDGENAKSYEEILKIAEGTLNTKIASRATGRPTHGAVGAARETGTVAPVNGAGGSYRRDTRKSDESSVQGTRPKWECYYCKKMHEGGWFRCEKRRAENPKWRPGDKPNSKKDFQRPPAS